MTFLQCSNPNRATRADDRRRHLLEVARKLFIDQGFHNTGVAQIATASGIKVGQIYRDFQGKEDIIAAIVEADITVFLDEHALCTAVTMGDSAAVRAWISRLFACDPIAQRQLMPEILAESVRNARIAAILRDVEERVRTSLLTALTTFMPDADRETDRSALADLILTLGIGLSQRRMADATLQVERLSAKIWQIVDREIAQSQGAGQRG